MIIVLTGPTGSGKTKMAIALAKKIDGEIVNGDAFQIYKELSIATAKPTLEERAEVPHHLFDFLPLSSSYSVAEYQRDCRRAIDDILSRGKTPIIAGGTGLYIRAALYDYDFSESYEFDMTPYESMDNEALYRLLEEADKDSASKIHPNNRIRVLRALQIYLSAGESKSSIEKKQKHAPIYDCLFFGVEAERENLYEKVERRIDEMLEDGLVEENLPLIEKYGRDANAFKAIGVKELFPYIDGKITLEEAVEQMKLATRHYVKRQMTFFHNQFDIRWINDEEEIIALMKQGE